MLTAVIVLGVLVFLLLGAVLYLLIVVHYINQDYVTYHHLNVRYDELKAIYKCLEDFIKETGTVLARDLDEERSERVRITKELIDDSAYLFSKFNEEALLNKACRETVRGLLKAKKTNEEQMTATGGTQIKKSRNKKEGE